MNKTYEITFITKEDNREKPVKAILEALTGKITNISSQGQKTFTYPIKKEKSGFYTTVSFEIEPEKVADFNKKLALEEEILRFLIVSTKPTQEISAKPVKIETEVEITAPVVTDIIKPETTIEIAPETEIVTVEKEKTEKPKKVKDDKPAKTEKTKVEKVKEVKVSKAVKELIEEPVSETERLDALDKKLEELLKE